MQDEIPRLGLPIAFPDNHPTGLDRKPIFTPPKVSDKATLRECLDKLERWEQHREIELYRDWARYSFDFSHLFSPRHCLRKRGTALGLSKTFLFKQRYPDGSQGIIG